MSYRKIGAGSYQISFEDRNYYFVTFYRLIIIK